MTDEELQAIAERSARATTTAGIAASLADIPRLLEAVKELTARLVENANEEPPSGWLLPGELGYENTPEGARQARIVAEQQLAAMTARCDKAIGLLSQLVAEVEDGSIPGCGAQLYEDARELVFPGKDRP